MLTQDTERGDIDEELEEAVAQWRERHQLREDDAVLLLVELFRIHQKHWDELRRHEMPSFEQVRGDIVRLAQTIRNFQCEAVALNTVLRSLPNAGHIRESLGRRPSLPHWQPCSQAISSE